MPKVAACELAFARHLANNLFFLCSDLMVDLNLCISFKIIRAVNQLCNRCPLHANPALITVELNPPRSDQIFAILKTMFLFLIYLKQKLIY